MNTRSRKYKRKYKYYEILGISKSATMVDIKKEYRRLIKKYHPDVNSDPKASEIVKELNKIFSILSNEQTRQEYDNAETECPNCYSHRILQVQIYNAVDPEWTCKDCREKYTFKKLQEKEEVKRDPYDVERCPICGNNVRFDGFLRLFVCKNMKCGERFAYKEIHKDVAATSMPVGRQTKNSFIGSKESFKVLKLTAGIAFVVCIIVTGYLLLVAIITSSVLAIGLSLMCIGFVLLSWYVFSYPQIVIQKIKALIIRNE